MPIALILMAIVIMGGIWVSVSILAKAISSSSTSYLEGAKVYESVRNSCQAFMGQIRT